MPKWLPAASPCYEEIMDVIVRACDNYSVEQILPIAEQMLHTIDQELTLGKTALLKVNLLSAAKPDQGVTTHPAVVEAFARVLKKKKMHVVIADSPGGPFISARLHQVYKATGMVQAALNSGALLNENLNVRSIHATQAHRLQHFEVLEAVLQADVIINLAKCKTHGMMTYTGAVKNLFGVIPGLTKANHHFRMQDPWGFAHHLVDIADFIKPHYNVIDAIVGMEGNGPASGTLRSVGVLAGSVSAFALDEVMTQIVGIPHHLVPTIEVARARGLSTPYEVDGELPVLTPPFKLPASAEVTFLPSWVPLRVRKRVSRSLRSKPVFLHDKCIGCRKCAEICPAKVITMNITNRPVCDYDHCISCFCCHEICPVRAIDIKKSRLGSLLKR